MARKVLFSLALVAAVASAGAVYALTESADIRTLPSFPLACQGGGNMKVSVLSRGHRGRTTFVVEFVRASQGANARAPGPGECAWLDRVIGPDEPNRLFMSMRGVVLDVTLDGRQRLVNWSAANLPSSSGGGISEGASIAVRAEVADRLLDNVLRGQPFRLRGYARSLGSSADVSGPVLVAWYE